MNTDNPDNAPVQGTSPLNFGGSSPFTSGQTEPLADVPATETQAETAPAEPLDNGEAGRLLAGEDADQVVAQPATDHDPVTETQPAVETPVEAEAPAEDVNQTNDTVPADAGEQPVTDTLTTEALPEHTHTTTSTETVGEVTAPTIEQEETAPVVPADVSTTPAADLAPNAEVPATPQTQLEAEVAKELEVQASNPAEAVATTVGNSAGIPAEAPTIAGKTDAEIEADIKARDALNAKIEDGQKAQRQDVIAQIKKVVETYKIPLAELGEALGIKGTRKGSKAKPKYRNPADGKEWSGRGKEPLWIKGKDRASFLITA